jgi:hypothetical protein
MVVPDLTSVYMYRQLPHKEEEPKFRDTLGYMMASWQCRTYIDVFASDYG